MAFRVQFPLHRWVDVRGVGRRPTFKYPFLTVTAADMLRFHKYLVPLFLFPPANWRQTNYKAASRAFWACA